MRKFVNVITLNIRKPTVETCFAEFTIKPEWPPLTEVSRFTVKVRGICTFSLKTK